MLLIIIVSAVVVYFTQKYLAYRKAVASVDGLGGYRTLFGMTSLVGAIPPPVKGLFPGNNCNFENKHQVHESVGWDIYASCSPFPTKVTLVLADADAIKEVTGSRHRFPKPMDRYEALKTFGQNILASDGDKWKRFRKICAPAFSDRNLKLVWDESMRTVAGLFDQVWNNEPVIHVDHCAEVTLQIALAVIGAAGFGRRISWDYDNDVPPGYSMSYNNAICGVAKGFILKMIVPKWASWLTQRTRHVEAAYSDFRQYMVEMITRRQEGDASKRHDLFSNLLDANEEEFDETTKLTKDELLSNIFIFLLAGHETTAHSLSFAFALLALYPEEQDALYEDIKSVVPDSRIPEYGDLMKLKYSWAVLNETLRLYTPSLLIPKCSAEDTTLTAGNIRGETRVIPVPKDTMIFISTPALHYNPKYWDDPYAFKPSRFMKDNWNRDAFIPFSAGARSCIGRKFNETESVAIITMMVLKYKITIKDEPQFSSETLEQRRERVTRNQSGITLTPLRTPLTFTRRN